MFKNYFISAFRNHLKNRWSSLINIFSLAIGIACSILIFVFVSHELSFDTFHKSTEDIYQAYHTIITGENEIHHLTLHPQELVDEIQAGFPGIKRATTYQQTASLIEYEDKQFDELFAKVDSTFLSMFSFPLTIGDPETVLKTHDQIVITEQLADKFFDNLNKDYTQVIGKVLTLNRWRDKKDYMISGVLKPLPKNSTLQFELLMLSKDNGHYSRSNNAFGEFSVYLQLEPEAEKKNVEKSLASIVQKIYGVPIKELQEREILAQSDDAFTFKMIPFKDVYFDSELNTRYVSKSNIMYSYILIGIGLLIIALACINFINLSIGRSLNRTLEIGIRKVLGAGRRQIVLQHILEKILLILFAVVTGYAISELLLPTFNQLAQKELSISISDNLGIPLFLLSVLTVTSFFAAGIPALILSKFSPVGVFKAAAKIGGKGRINSVLVIVQFFLSIILLSSVFIMSRQITFMLNKNLGFDKDQLLVIPIAKKYSALYKTKIKEYPQILNATGCDRNFTNGSSHRAFNTRDGKPIYVSIIRVDEDYLNTLGIDLIEGRNFSKAFPSDGINSVLVNETFLEEFNLQHPLGQTIKGDTFKNSEESPAIIGVINDYHLSSMRQEIPPLMLHMCGEINGGWSLLAKVETTNMQETIGRLKSSWKQIVPDREFSYRFLNEDWARKYQDERRWQKITSVSMLLAFIISSLGLFGMTTIITNTRTKEIGIRKVLGASVTSVVTILTKDITKWVIIANVLAFPLTWYIMYKWLENYVYRIQIEWWVFVVAGIMTILIALLTVGFQAIRASLANPVEALRYE